MLQVLVVLGASKTWTGHLLGGCSTPYLSWALLEHPLTAPEASVHLETCVQLLRTFRWSLWNYFQDIRCTIVADLFDLQWATQCWVDEDSDLQLACRPRLVKTVAVNDALLYSDAVLKEYLPGLCTAHVALVHLESRAETVGDRPASFPINVRRFQEVVQLDFEAEGGPDFHPVQP